MMDEKAIHIRNQRTRYAQADDDFGVPAVFEPGDSRPRHKQEDNHFDVLAVIVQELRDLGTNGRTAIFQVPAFFAPGDSRPRYGREDNSMLQQSLYQTCET